MLVYWKEKTKKLLKESNKTRNTRISEEKLQTEEKTKD